MLLYSVIMFVASAGFTVISVLIYRGRTELIHSYHQTRVRDKKAYGKAFGKALLVIAAALLVSGILGLLGETGTVAMAAVSVLAVGTAVGLGCILAVQKKYNNGLF